MKTVTVQTIKSFTYQGRAYETGEPVTMVPLEAAAHARRGHVSLQRATLSSNFIENRQLVVETAAVPVRRRPGRPRKSSTQQPSTPEPDRPRTYRRTDMTAEESKG